MPHVDRKIKTDQRDHGKSSHADDALPISHFCNPAVGKLEWNGTAQLRGREEHVQDKVEHDNDEIDSCISRH